MNIQSSQLGFGCEQLGGHAWGSVEPEAIMSAIHKAMDRGVSLFDTADVYGLGESERRLGEALHGRRSRALIMTKFGVRISESTKASYDMSPEWLDIALSESLKRLRTDYIDYYLVHYDDKKTRWEETFQSLERKVRSGQIRFYGVSNFYDPAMSDVSNYPSFRTVQMEYSLAEMKNLSVIQNVAKSGHSPIFYGALGRGILTGKYRSSVDVEESDRRRDPRYLAFHGEQLKKNLETVERMKIVAQNRQCTLAQLAIRWALDSVGAGLALVGLKTGSQLEECLASQGWKLSAEEVRFLSPSIGAYS